MSRSRVLTRRRRALIASTAVAALTLAGCSMESLSLGGDGAIATSSIEPSFARDRASEVPDDVDLMLVTERAAQLAMQEGDTASALAHLSRLHEAKPNDKQITFDYARHLRYVGAETLAERILNDGLAAHPGDRDLRLEKAKLLIGAGRPSEAIAILTGLRDEAPGDPEVLSPLGVAHDRRGEHAEAQAIYAKAMTTGRPAASLLNNAGLSHLLSGDTPEAVKLLRQAAVAPGANAQVRQNLALALTLNGESAEARKFATEGAPPEISGATLGEFKRIKSVDHPWSRAAGG